MYNIQKSFTYQLVNSNFFMFSFLSKAPSRRLQTKMKLNAFLVFASSIETSNNSTASIFCLKQMLFAKNPNLFIINYKRREEFSQIKMLDLIKKNTN